MHIGSIYYCNVYVRHIYMLITYYVIDKNKDNYNFIEEYVLVVFS